MVSVDQVVEKKRRQILFRKKMAMIQKHMKSHKHILRMFIDAFVKTMNMWVAEQDNPSTASDDLNQNDSDQKSPNKDNKMVLEDIDEYSRISYDDESDEESCIVTKSPTSV